VSDPIIIADYHPDWPRMFEAERQRIVDAIGLHITTVEHVGSTSVPGLAAKPIIDMLVGLRSLGDAVYCVAPLTALGYEYVPQLEAMLPERRYFRRFQSGIRTHQIHMVEEGGPFWTRHLQFRDYLRAHPVTAAEYETLKRRLADEFTADRPAYTDAKTAFIRRVEALARGE
jgi:GrpB-like predicted nucleotidyltransferase (UPF0157 family)